MNPIDLKRRVRRSSLESLSNGLNRFKLAGITDKEALAHMIDIARAEFTQARKNYRGESVSHWRTYHKFSALCAVYTVMHARKLQSLCGLGESAQ